MATCTPRFAGHVNTRRWQDFGKVVAGFSPLWSDQFDHSFTPSFEKVWAQFVIWMTQILSLCG